MTEHKFWNLQPVNQNNILPYGQIKELEKRINEYKLPDGYFWIQLDITDDGILTRCCDFLKENYAEDSCGKFRFNYSKEFLRYALIVPNWKPNWIIGVIRGGELYGMITGVPIELNVGKMCEINFLCVHKKLRSMRLAPVLIKEITRRVVLDGINQAVYTSGTELPTPIGNPANYWSRQLNVKKLVETGYSSLSERQTIERMMKLLKLPVASTIDGWRKMKIEDSEKVLLLLNDYLSKFKLSVKFSLEEVKHMLVPRDGVLSSYVVEENNRIVSFASFYHLNSTVIGSKYKDLYAAYSYYNVSSEKYNIEDLIYNLLIEANNQKIDVFTMLNLMENEKALKKLYFQLGSGNLRYYLYNFSLGELCNSDQIGVVMY